MNRVRLWWEDGWLLEILSCALAIASLTAIIVVLAYHQNKPLPEWPKLISINAMVSVFTVLMKGGLLMPLSEGIGSLKWLWYRDPRRLADLDDLDAASRGPWGAFLLLLNRRRQ